MSYFNVKINMDYIFILVSAIIAIIFFLLFSDKGRVLLIKLFFGEIKKDYGTIGSVPFFKGLFVQNLKMYKCFKNNEEFFVLELRMSGNIQYIKINGETSRKMLEIFSEK